MHQINHTDNIVITGAAGFIGSCLISFLNDQGYENLLLVDDFSKHEKDKNLSGKKFNRQIEREVFFEWLQNNEPKIKFIFHLGARTDTTEFDYAVHEHLNVDYSKKIWRYAAEHQIPLVYASSAATYGDGNFGYDDDHSLLDKLAPLNPYGVSKHEFDKWALLQNSTPPFWAGLKFFNVYGPNEYHKGRMASVIFHSLKQIKENGYVKLFKSHRDGYNDGEQLRDFIYVKDIVQICDWLMKNQPASAIYNLGTGKARTFNDLVTSTFAAMDLQPEIRYIDMPEDIRESYQYFTEATMNKLSNAGYQKAFFSLEAGINDYVRNYLAVDKFY